MVQTLTVFDAITGYAVSLSLFYAIPVFVVAWCMGKETGVLIAIVCGIVWWWASGAAATQMYGPVLILWETFGRTGFFIFVAIGAASLKRERQASASRIELLEHSRRLEHEIVEISEREQRRIGRDAFVSHRAGSDQQRDTPRPRGRNHYHAREGR